MFRERQINDKINKQHEITLRIVHNDIIMPFDKFLDKDKTYDTS